MNMEHMKFLQAVVDGDVKVLREKEATYQGSWKAAGGRSAWFMFRRNMDRLLTMMAPKQSSDDVMQTLFDHKHGAQESGGETTIDVGTCEMLMHAFAAEDIFMKINENPSGADGTVLACMQDLRRYATLVEAEMMARGVIADPRSKMSGVPVSSFSGMMTITPGTPEDGGHHDGHVEYCSPWVSPSDVIGSDVYKQHAPNVFVLEQHVETCPPSDVASRYFVLRGVSGFVLNMAACPDRVRSYFPSLPMEQNATELSTRPQWQRMMYREEETKHVLLPLFHAWHVDSEEI